MKLVICHKGKKREIDGDFSMCIGIQELDSLMAALQAMKDRGMSFGWIDVRDRIPTPANTPPSPWVDG